MRVVGPLELAFVLLGVVFAAAVATQNQHRETDRHLRYTGLAKRTYMNDFRTTQDDVVVEDPPTLSPSVAPTARESPTINCGCQQDCTAEMLQQDANGQTCLERIQTRILSLGNTELEACTAVAASYPTQCGPQCHPEKCQGQAPALCNCDACTTEIWNTDVGSFSCGTRVLLSMSSRTEEEACRRIAESYPTEYGLCHPDTCPLP